MITVAQMAKDVGLTVAQFKKLRGLPAMRKGKVDGKSQDVLVSKDEYRDWRKYRGLVNENNTI
jgi:hypothetical protein